jgi:hypothetical protein
MKKYQRLFFTITEKSLHLYSTPTGLSTSLLHPTAQQIIYEYDDGGVFLKFQG